jgi:hypothetical protein
MFVTNQQIGVTNMGNVYTDHKDDVIGNMMDEMHSRLTNSGGVSPHGFHDRYKPTLVPPVLPPSKIKPTREWPKRTSIDLPE